MPSYWLTYRSTSKVVPPRPQMCDPSPGHVASNSGTRSRWDEATWLILLIGYRFASADGRRLPSCFARVVLMAVGPWPRRPPGGLATADGMGVQLSRDWNLGRSSSTAQASAHCSISYGQSWSWSWPQRGNWQPYSPRSRSNPLLLM